MKPWVTCTSTENGDRRTDVTMRVGGVRWSGRCVAGHRIGQCRSDCHNVWRYVFAISQPSSMPRHYIQVISVVTSTCWFTSVFCLSHNSRLTFHGSFCTLDCLSLSPTTPTMMSWRWLRERPMFTIW